MTQKPQRYNYVKLQHVKSEVKLLYEKICSSCVRSIVSAMVDARFMCFYTASSCGKVVEVGILYGIVIHSKRIKYRSDESSKITSFKNIVIL